MELSSKIKIEKLNLISFGKFQNFEIDFNDGLNIIYGKNEAGKSTIQLFIKAMLYGLPARKKSGEVLKDRERIIPWGKTKAEGVMVINADGRSIEIRKSFGKTASGDKTEVYDSITGTPIENGLGEELLLIPCEVFEKTVWIKQSDVFVDDKDGDLSKRMINLSTGGDEEVSADSALKFLAEKRKEIKARDGRSAKGKIDELLDRKEECIKERYNLSTQLSQISVTEDKIRALKEEKMLLDEQIEKDDALFQKSMEAEKYFAIKERVRQIDDCDRRIKEIESNKDYILASDLTQEYVEELRRTEAELDSISKQAETVKKLSLTDGDNLRIKAAVYLASGAVAALFGIAGTIAFGLLTQIGMLIVSLAVAVFGLISVLMGIRTNSISKNIKEEMDANKAEYESLKNIENSLEDKHKQMRERYSVENTDALSRLYMSASVNKQVLDNLIQAKKGLLGKDEYNELKALAEENYTEDAEKPKDIEARLSGNRARQLQLVSEIQALESKMAYDCKITALPSDIETEIRAIDEELELCEKRLKVIELAEKAIKEASENWRRAFSPALNKRASEIFSHITGGKYDEVKVLEDYRMRVTTRDGQYSAEYLSYGTYEQMYLALRLASAESLCDKCPIFLDDILTVYDNDRAEATLKFLNDANKQTLLFTCQENNTKVADAHIIKI